jgi:phosphoribosylformimino-5-aminoimidazole carboxamide ribotide isomerase
MFLIIPVIELSEGHVVRQVKGIDGAVYPSDPAALARIWRRENAKVLHLTDKDSLQCGQLLNIEAIRNVVGSVDIPIEVSGDIYTYEQCTDLFAAGVYRVVVNVVRMRDSDELQRIVDEFLPQRVVAGFTASYGRVLNTDGTQCELAPVPLGHKLKEAGFSRAVYRNVEEQSGELMLDLDALRDFATATRLRVTAAGGIRRVEDLWAVQALEPDGVDSIILGKSLYENRFPCQKLWRLAEAAEK